MSATQPTPEPLKPLSTRAKTLVGAAFAGTVGAGYVALTKDWGAAMAAAQDGFDLAKVYGQAALSFGGMLGIPLYGTKVLSKGQDEETVSSVMFYALTAVGVSAGVLLAHDAREDALVQARLAKLPLLSEHTIIKAATARDEACKGIIIPKLAPIVYEGKEYAVKCPGAHPLMPN